MGNRSKRRLTGQNVWDTLAIILGVLCLVPFVLLLKGAWQADKNILQTLFFSVLPGYLVNTLLLCAGVLVASLAIGVTTAWFVSQYEFPLRKFFTVLLPISIIISPYMRGLVFMEYANSLQFVLSPFLQKHLPGLAAIFNQWGNFPFLIMTLTLSLFPYVYVFASALYSKNSRALIDNARLLNCNRRSLFFAVGLPLAAPALRLGAAVVLMDTLNEYGAISYFGFPTISSAVFRTWFVYKDIGSAKFLATLVLLLIIFLVSICQRKDGKIRYDTQHYYPASRERLSFARGLGLGIFCAIWIFLGFLLPLYHFVLWTAKAATMPQLWRLSLDTLALLTIAVAIGILLAVPLGYLYHVRSGGPYKPVFNGIAMGYAIPSTIVGIAVLGLVYFLSEFSGSLPGLLVGQTIAGLVFAIVLRFFFVIAKPIYQGFHHHGRRYQDAARSLGATKIFWRVALPLNTPFVCSGALLLFIEILKEIPLTLILRPFNFNTLAVNAYLLARDEMLFSSSFPTLLIIGIGLLGILLFQWIEHKWKLI